jgi:hypothetical protein
MKLSAFQDIEEELQEASWVELLFGGRLLRDAIVLQNLEIGDQQVVVHVSWEALLPDRGQIRTAAEEHYDSESPPPDEPR